MKPVFEIQRPSLTAAINYLQTFNTGTTMEIARATGFRRVSMLKTLNDLADDGRIRRVIPEKSHSYWEWINK